MIDHLVEAFQSDSSADRKSALEAFIGIGKNYPNDEKSREVITYVLELMGSNSVWGNKGAHAILSEIGEPIVQALIEELQNSTGKPNRAWITAQIKRLLLHIGPVSVKYLVQTLQDPNYRAKGEVTALLANFDVSPYLAEIAAYLEDGEMKIHILRLLLPYDFITWAPAVVQMLDDSDSQIRAYAAQVCGECKVRSAEPRLIELLQDSSMSIAAVIRALGMLEATCATEELIKIFDNVVRTEQHAIIRALGNIRDNRAIPFLVGNLQNGDHTLRDCAAEALAHHQDELVLLYVSILENNSSYVWVKQACFRTRELFRLERVAKENKA